MKRSELFNKKAKQQNLTEQRQCKQSLLDKNLVSSNRSFYQRRTKQQLTFARFWSKNEEQKICYDSCDMQGCR